jgi:hypothetical protein
MATVAAAIHLRVHRRPRPSTSSSPSISLLGLVELEGREVPFRLVDGH